MLKERLLHIRRHLRLKLSEERVGSDMYPIFWTFFWIK